MQHKVNISSHVAPTTSRGGTKPNRQKVNARFSRMLHKIAGRLLLDDPEYLVRTKNRLDDINGLHPKDREEWGKILRLPPKEIARVICKDTVDMERLRSVSPFILPGNFMDPIYRASMIRKAARGVSTYV